MHDKIVHFLKENENYLSGEEISRSLKMSRAAVWKYMQELKKSGYDIVAVPHLGYRLISSPDKLYPWEGLSFEVQFLCYPMPETLSHRRCHFHLQAALLA